VPKKRPNGAPGLPWLGDVVPAGDRLLIGRAVWPAGYPKISPAVVRGFAHASRGGGGDALVIEAAIAEVAAVGLGEFADGALADDRSPARKATFAPASPLQPRFSSAPLLAQATATTAPTSPPQIEAGTVTVGKDAKTIAPSTQPKKNPGMTMKYFIVFSRNDPGRSSLDCRFRRVSTGAPRVWNFAGRPHCGIHKLAGEG